MRPLPFLAYAASKYPFALPNSKVCKNDELVNAISIPQR
jgi:hypothetical protein